MKRSLLVLNVFMMMSLYSSECDLSRSTCLGRLAINMCHSHKKNTYKMLNERIASIQKYEQKEIQAFLVQLLDEDCNLYEADIKKLFGAVTPKGFDLNFMVEDKNLTLINYAIEKSVTPATLTLLLEKGCTLRSPDGQNSLLLALENEVTKSKKDHQLIKVLLEHGANPNAIDDLLKEIKKNTQALSQVEGKRTLDFIKKIENHVNLAKERMDQYRFVICRLFINESLEPFPLPGEVAYKIAEYTFPYND